MQQLSLPHSRPQSLFHCSGPFTFSWSSSLLLCSDLLTSIQSQFIFARLLSRPFKGAFYGPLVAAPAIDSQAPVSCGTDGLLAQPSRCRTLLDHLASQSTTAAAGVTTPAAPPCKPGPGLQRASFLFVLRPLGASFRRHLGHSREGCVAASNPPLTAYTGPGGRSRDWD